MPAFGKIIEKVVALQIHEHFNKNLLFCRSQYGFRGKSSTEDAVLALVDYVSENIDVGNYVLGVFLDVAKAFDCIDRQILIRKLEIYGIRNSENAFFRS